MDHLTLTLLAHLSAHRRLLINLFTMKFIDNPEPMEAASALRERFAGHPTQAPDGGSGLDPVVSDMLAAMTDDAIDDLLQRVILRLHDLRSSSIPPAVSSGANSPNSLQKGTVTRL